MKKTTYVQFKAPKSEQKGQTDGILKRNIKKAVIGIVSAVIPKANPDFEDKIDFVETWIVELDDETGIPEREIGMDKDGRIIVKMPFKNNYGYWTDNNLLLADFKNHFETKEIQSNGADGGHKYLKTKIEFKGQNREMIILFTNKSDEEKLTELNKIKVRGKIVDDGIEQPLTLFESRLITK